MEIKLPVSEILRRPVSSRGVNEQTIRERAEFLALEIHEDRLAPRDEIADAIETEIRRFASRVHLERERIVDAARGRR